MSSFVDPTLLAPADIREADPSANAMPQVHALDLADLNASIASSERPRSSIVPSLNPLRKVKASLQVCVGSASVTVGELLDAKAQQVLVLDRSVSQPVDLILEGQVVARGQLVAVGNQFAVRLMELPVSLNTQGS